MKTKLCTLLIIAASLLTGCGNDKPVNADLYKNIPQVSVGPLSFNFQVPAAMASGASVEILVKFSVENTGSKPYELTFTKKPYFYKESDNTTYEATGSISTVPTSYVLEKGESQIFSFKTTYYQTVIVVGGYTDGYCFAFEYNENISIKYHLYDKVD